VAWDLVFIVVSKRARVWGDLMHKQDLCDFNFLTGAKKGSTYS
jgi:hypothetical protein